MVLVVVIEYFASQKSICFSQEMWIDSIKNNPITIFSNSKSSII